MVLEEHCPTPLRNKEWPRYPVILNSHRAIQVNIEIMRAIVRLRQMLATNKDLARKVAELEKKYDSQFKIVFDALRELIKPPTRPRRKIGFEGKT